MQRALFLLVLLTTASCGEAKENKGGTSDTAIVDSCKTQTEAMVRNQLPMPQGATAQTVTDACIAGAKRYRNEVTKPVKGPVTPATNR